MTTRQLASALALLALCQASASAHRLDEYLQATLLAIEKDSVQGEMRLAPGVAVASFLLTGIDKNGDSMLSGPEQEEYAARVLREVKLTVDGQAMTPRLISVRAAEVDQIKEGMGEIQIQFQADLPRGGPKRQIVFENHHQTRISVYLVNCLAPGNEKFQMLAQRRNERQSFYQLDYVQTAESTGAGLGWHDGRIWLALAALVLFARVVGTLTGRSDHGTAIRS